MTETFFLQLLPTLLMRSIKVGKFIYHMSVSLFLKNGEVIKKSETELLTVAANTHAAYSVLPTMLVILSRHFADSRRM
jgi:hypothetical protein